MIKEDFEMLIKKAKKDVENKYGGEKRKWLKAIGPHSYGDAEYKVELFVYEGSPPKGYVLADYDTRTIKTFGVGLHPGKTYRGEYSP